MGERIHQTNRADEQKYLAQHNTDTKQSSRAMRKFPAFSLKGALP